MGNSESSPVKEKQLLQDKNLESEQTINDPRYGECRIMRDTQNGRCVAIISKTFGNRHTWEKARGECQNALTVQHDNVVRLQDFVAQKKDEFCASFYRIKLLYEYVNFDMERDIARRINKGHQQQNEDELWQILSSAIQGLLQQKQRNMTHGDIRPQTLVLSDEAKIKILVSSVVNQGLTSQTQHLVGIREESCQLSPILLKALQQREQRPVQQPTKSDVFSLGMSVLEAASLERVSDCQDFDAQQIIQQNINRHLSALNDRQSSSLVTFLRQMLVVDEMQRPDVEHLFSNFNQLVQQEINGKVAERVYTANPQQMNSPISSPLVLNLSPVKKTDIHLVTHSLTIRENQNSHLNDSLTNLQSPIQILSDNVKSRSVYPTTPNTITPNKVPHVGNITENNSSIRLTPIKSIIDDTEGGGSYSDRLGGVDLQSQRLGDVNQQIDGFGGANQQSDRYTPTSIKYEQQTPINIQSDKYSTVSVPYEKQNSSSTPYESQNQSSANYNKQNYSNIQQEVQKPTSTTQDKQSPINASVNNQNYNSTSQFNQNSTLTPKQDYTLTPKQDYTLTPKQDYTLTPKQNPTLTPKQNSAQDRQIPLTDYQSLPQPFPRMLANDFDQQLQRRIEEAIRNSKIYTEAAPVKPISILNSPPISTLNNQTTSIASNSQPQRFTLNPSGATPKSLKLNVSAKPLPQDQNLLSRPLEPALRISTDIASPQFPGQGGPFSFTESPGQPQSNAAQSQNDSVVENNSALQNGAGSDLNTRSNQQGVPHKRRNIESFGTPSLESGTREQTLGNSDNQDSSPKNQNNQYMAPAYTNNYDGILSNKNGYRVIATNSQDAYPGTQSSFELPKMNTGILNDAGPTLRNSNLQTNSVLKTSRNEPALRNSNLQTNSALNTSRNEPALRNSNNSVNNILRTSNHSKVGSGQVFSNNYPLDNYNNANSLNNYNQADLFNNFISASLIPSNNEIGSKRDSVGTNDDRQQNTRASDTRTSDQRASSYVASNLVNKLNSREGRGRGSRPGPTITLYSQSRANTMIFNNLESIPQSPENAGSSGQPNFNF